MAASLRGRELGSRRTSIDEDTADKENLVRALVGCSVCELVMAAIVTCSYDL
jgi:hypothetical protein